MAARTAITRTTTTLRPTLPPEACFPETWRIRPLLPRQAWSHQGQGTTTHAIPMDRERRFVLQCRHRARRASISPLAAEAVVHLRPVRLCDVRAHGLAGVAQGASPSPCFGPRSRRLVLTLGWIVFPRARSARRRCATRAACGGRRRCASRTARARRRARAWDPSCFRRQECFLS